MRHVKVTITYGVMEGNSIAVEILQGLGSGCAPGQSFGGAIAYANDDILDYDDHVNKCVRKIVLNDTDRCR
jgi:hypothetical protein